MLKRLDAENNLGKRLSNTNAIVKRKRMFSCEPGLYIGVNEARASFSSKESFVVNYIIIFYSIVRSI